MVKIRLMRVGATKKPVYRVVVSDSRSPRDGRFIEIIGQYDPKTHPSTMNVDEAKALAWLEKGAQPTDQVRAILKRTGIYQKFTSARPAPKPPKPRVRKPKPDKAKAAS